MPTSTTQDGTTPTPSEEAGQRGSSLLGGEAPGTVNPDGVSEQTSTAPAAEPLKWDALALPENLEVPEDVQTEFLGIVNDGALSAKDRAEKTLQLHVRMMESAATEMERVWGETQEKWRSETLALPEFSGGKSEAALAEVSRLVNRYGGPEVRKAFDLTGAGNHPAIVQFLYKMAKDFNEQPPVSGAPVIEEARSRAERIYGNKENQP